MWKSLFYKEWLKIRWFLIGYTILAVCGLAYLFLKLKHGFAFSGGKNMWNEILFLGEQFYRPLKFVPLAGGILTGIVQFYPETIDKRIKLTFHLPASENKAMLLMKAMGAGSLFLSLVAIYALFAGISAIYFPLQVVIACLISVLPWFLAGLSAYFFVALIILEPIWKYRFFFLVIGSFLLSMYLISAVTGAYGPATSGLAVLTVLLSVTPLFSAYRLRKGEM